MMDWPTGRVLQLLEAYKNASILWDSKDANYYNATKKTEAWQEIAKKLDSTREECKKKMDSLKASYRREKAKTRRSNSGGDEVYKTRWFAYEAMKFLDDVAVTRDTTTGWNSDFSEEVDDSLENNHLPTKTTKMSHRTGRKRKLDDTQAFHQPVDSIHAETSYVQYYNDVEAVQSECSAFGAYVSNKLRRYNDRERAIVQHRISSVFFDIDMAMYSVDESQAQPVSTRGMNTQFLAGPHDDRGLSGKASHSADSDSP